MKHPRLITALGITALVLAFTIPTALAAKPNVVPGSNCGHKRCHTSTTTTRTITTTGTITSTYPITTTITTTGTTTTTETSPVRICNPNDKTAAPCGKNKSADLGAASGIPVWAVFLVLGILVTGYLWIHRRRTLKLEE
jgi:hypothetical protein